MKMLGEWRCNSTILNLSASCEWVISCTPLPLYPWGNSPQYPLCRRLVGPQSQSGCYGEERNHLLLPRIRPQLLSRPGSLVTIPTELSCHILFWLWRTSEKLNNKLILFSNSSIMKFSMLFVRFNGTCIWSAHASSYEKCCCSFINFYTSVLHMKQLCWKSAICIFKLLQWINMYVTLICVHNYTVCMVQSCINLFFSFYILNELLVL
jgi:hypothetical protein